FVSASIGLLVTEPGSRPPGSSDALRAADQALYAAKAAGRNQVTEFQPSLLDEGRQRARTGAELQRAVAKEELVLHYQPIVKLDEGRITGIEALVRWTPSGGRTLSPAEFIPLAEQTGLIIDIGTWVLRRACRDARAWNQRYGVSLGVNVSG